MAERQRNQPERPESERTQPEAAEEYPTRRNCGVMLVHERLLRTDPAYARARVASENSHFAVQSGQRPLARSGITTIPVVVHVVYHTEAQNISQAQIQSQIDVLNRDFRRTNPDVASVPAAFSSLVADARIQFTMATSDPSGAATDGITRTSTTRTSFSDDDQVKSDSTGGVDPWPADRYLNIWVVPRLTSAIGDLLGYAQFPGGPATTDGVVILHTAFGTTGTAAAPFNLGRTTTHEVGHWLNLRHIWGDDGNGCNGDDFVTDTPNQAGPNYGTPAFPNVSCNNGPSGDLFMDYMDYVDDVSMFMFTVGQVVRMQACLDSDRTTIGTTVAAPTSAILDQVLTLKFRDDFPPKFKFRDDIPTFKFRDDFPPKFKFFDDGFRPPTAMPMVGTGGAAGGPAPAAPFVLSTPHHSMAWLHTAPAAVHHLIAAAQHEAGRYEAALSAYAQADAAGQLGPADRQQADALYAEYAALMEYLRQTLGM